MLKLFPKRVKLRVYGTEYFEIKNVSFKIVNFHS
jgi:hypothetical protein